MKICSKKDIKVMAGILAAVSLLGGCNADIREENTGKILKNQSKARTEIELSEVSNTGYIKPDMDKLYRKYCCDIFSQTVRDYGGDENIMISPASIMMALDMVSAGAKGDSLRQLTDLFAEGQGPLTQQAYAADLMKKINESEKIKFSCANAIWSNKDILGDSVNTEYVDYVKNTFGAEYTVDGFTKKTPDEINQWIGNHTDHMIEKAIDELDPETVMVLVNAIAFDGKWERKYEESQVSEGGFTKYDGTTQNVDFLHGMEFTYFETEKATGFMKEYEGGQYAFLAILPTNETISANEFIRGFTAEDYEAFIDSKSIEYEVVTKLPVFKYDFEFTLNDTIENMGAGNVFHSATADLSGITGEPGDLYVSKVIHKTHIEVDTEGTKAAAVTAVSLNAAGAQPVSKEMCFVECDRPFAYAIIDMESEAPIFIGTVNQV